MVLQLVNFRLPPETLAAVRQEAAERSEAEKRKVTMTEVCRDWLEAGRLAERASAVAVVFTVTSVLFLHLLAVLV